jgi:hypothetical protein
MQSLGGGALWQKAPSPRFPSNCAVKLSGLRLGGIAARLRTSKRDFMLAIAIAEPISYAIWHYFLLPWPNGMTPSFVSGAPSYDPLTTGITRYTPLKPRGRSYLHRMLTTPLISTRLEMGFDMLKQCGRLNSNCTGTYRCYFRTT